MALLAMSESRVFVQTREASTTLAANLMFSKASRCTLRVLKRLTMILRVSKRPEAILRVSKASR